jgi:ABC-2 type transport system permease protein
MNIFLRELKAHRWGLLFWSLGMMSMVYMGMTKYGAYEASGESVQEIMDALPKAVGAVFGLTGFDLSTAAGFFGVLFLYIAIIGAVHAVLLGSGLIAKEERDRTSEFLYSKPASRARILTGKLLAGVFNLVVLNVVTLATSLWVVDMFNKDAPFDGDIVLLMVGLFFIQLVFFSIGALLAGSTHRPKAASSRASSIMFVTFLLAFVVNMNEKLDFLRYFTPFKYFDAANLMADHALDPLFVVLAVAIIGIAVAATYRLYAARDLNV